MVGIHVNWQKGFIAFLLLTFVSDGLSAQAIKSYTWDETSLMESRKRVFADDPYLTGATSPVASVMANADKCVNLAPVSVVEKSGDWQIYFPNNHVVNEREYVSVSGYHWPVVGHETDGTPWVYDEARGLNNAMMAKYNNVSIKTMRDIVVNCAKGYYFSKDAAAATKYANAAIKQLRVWFIDNSTAMLPQMDHAGFVPFSSLGVKYGIIDMSVLHSVLNSIEMLKPSGLWTANDEAVMKKWCFDFATWLETGPFKDEGRVANNNNHGAYYDVILIAQWMYLGANYNGVDYLAKAKKYIQSVSTARFADLFGSGQMVTDNYGAQKINYNVYDGVWIELHRPNASMYSVFCMDALVYIAIEAQKLGIDLWNYTTATNQSLRKAIEWYIPYIDGSKTWTFGDEVNHPFNGVTGLLWTSSAYIGAHEALLNNYSLNQSSMSSVDVSEQNLFSPRTYYYYDDFVCKRKAVNLTTYRGGEWVASNNEMVQATNAAAIANNTPGSVVLHGSYIKSDYIMEANMKLTSTNANDGMGLVFMAYTSTNYGGVENYYYLLLSKNASESGVYKVKGNGTVGGTTRTKLVSFNQGVVTNTVYNIKVKRLKNSTFFYLDNKRVGQMTDVSYTTGRSGFCSQNGSCSVLDVSIKKATNDAPVVALTNSNTSAVDNFILQAEAQDADGTIAKVVFYNGTQKLGEDAQAPYTFLWTNIASGTYSIWARAFDNLGDSAVSKEMEFTVDVTTALIDVDPSNYLVAYPNPTTGIIYFQNENHHVLCNAQGEILKNGKGASLDISELSSGVYFLTIDYKTYKIVRD